MIIGIDGHSLLNPETIAGKCTLQMVERLATEYPEDRIYVYVTRMRKDSEMARLCDFHNVEFRLPAQSGFQGRLWRMFGVTNNLDVDKTEIFHGPTRHLPLNIVSSHLPAVVTVTESDLNATELQSLGAKIRNFLASRACSSATRIITDSVKSRQRIIQKWGISTAKIDVIPFDEEGKMNVGDIRRSYTLARESYESANRC